MNEAEWRQHYCTLQTSVDAWILSIGAQNEKRRKKYLWDIKTENPRQRLIDDLIRRIGQEQCERTV